MILLVYKIMPPGTPNALIWTGAVGLSLIVACGLGIFDLAVHSRLKRALKRVPPDVLPWLTRGFAVLFVAAAGVGSTSAVLEQRVEQARLRAAEAVRALPVAAFASRDAARAVVTGLAREAPNLTGSILRVKRTREGTLVARGWAIDREDERALVFVALAQDGALLGVNFGIPRSALAIKLGLPNIGKASIGLSQPLRGAACGVLVAVAVAPDGRMAALDVADKPPGCP